uniref:Uncharacterized protein n=1 Tax=Bionectria ochroleuca TaxID=29856 RepID=A0A0B7JHP3_BIOOC
MPNLPSTLTSKLLLSKAAPWVELEHSTHQLQYRLCLIFSGSSSSGSFSPAILNEFLEGDL